MALVLVVDDEQDIRDLIQLNLEAAGYDVVTADSGTAALEVVGRITPDAMFLDLMMPGGDGFSVLEALKRGSTSDLSRIPVFMVTGMGEMEHRLRGGIEGALQYITKPFDPVELVAALEAVLDPDAEPEPVLRRRVQSESLEQLARYERTGEELDGSGSPEPRVRLTRLEHAPSTPAPSPKVRVARERIAELTEKQQQLLRALASGLPVATVAEEQGMSRSNIYASLRRIGRRLSIENTNELLAMLRQGLLVERNPL